MTTISATKLRNHLFDCLNEVARGKSIAVERNGRIVGKIVPIKRGAWRDRLTVKPRLRVSDKDAFLPLKDIWKDFI